MKQYLYTLPAAFFFWLCTACTEADIVLPANSNSSDNSQNVDTDKGVPLTVKELGLSLEVESRAGGVISGAPQDGPNNPNPVKKIRVCVAGDNYDPNPYDSIVPTVVFDYDDGLNRWVQAPGTPTLYLNSRKARAFAFAPPDHAVDFRPWFDYGPIVTGVVVKAKQTFRLPASATEVPWDTDQEDYLASRQAGIEGLDRFHPDVSLQMNHILSKVSFRVMEKDAGTFYQGSKVSKVELINNAANQHFRTLTDGEMDIYHNDIGDSITGQGYNYIPADTLTFEADPATMRTVGSGTALADKATVPVQAFGLVLGTYTLSAILKLTLDDGHVFTTAPFEINWAGGGYEYAPHYVYTLLLTPKGIEISDPAVEPWESGAVPNPDVPVAPAN